MFKLNTSMIVVVSLAAGIIGGAAVTAIADQPNMQSALDHLVTAEGYLNRANDNKAGHRAKALELVNQAIKEVREGMEAGE